MSINIQSSDIQIFPLAQLRAERPNDATLSELNLTNIIASLSDYSSFLVQYSPSNNYITFVLCGYRIHVANCNEAFASLLTEENEGKYLTATMEIDRGESDSSIYALKGEDEETTLTDGTVATVFTGVSFELTDDYQKEDTNARLSLLQCVNIGGIYEWNTASRSLLKFRDRSLDIQLIDGGED